VPALERRQSTNRAKEDRMSVATARGIDRNTSANRAAA
jgi:hypothetical protein